MQYTGNGSVDGNIAGVWKRDAPALLTGSRVARARIARAIAEGDKIPGEDGLDAALVIYFDGVDIGRLDCPSA